MAPSIRLTGIVSILASILVLSGCGGSSGGGGGGSTPPPPPPPPPPPAAGPPSVELAAVFSDVSFQSPVKLLQAPGDSSRWFVVEQRGMVWTFENDPNVSSVTLFIDISARVDSGPNEAGLLGMAFHPDWGVSNNFEVFLSYTRTASPLESHISRFFSLDNGLTLDSGVEEVIMTVLQDFGNHNGGNIVFGPDGFLYAGWGDGGGAGDDLDRAQNTGTVLGSFTRVDVDNGAPYTIPASNPFSGNALCVQGFGSAPCPEIFAFGLRNPWRWSFDRLTGDLWAADVGQNAIEEVDVIGLGGNYGWRCQEGSTVFNTSGVCPGGLINPITEYDHSVGQSITGGYVYRGTAVPDLSRYYVFADFITGVILGLPATSGTGSTADELLDSSFLISTFAEDNDGELYILDFGAGSIYQLVSGP